MKCICSECGVIACMLSCGRSTVERALKRQADVAARLESNLAPFQIEITPDIEEAIETLGREIRHVPLNNRVTVNHEAAGKVLDLLGEFLLARAYAQKGATP